MFKSFGEMFEDPTAPMSPFAKTWEVSACSSEEIVKSYGAVATLAPKVTRVAVEHRQEAASACWHALQCINHIYARLGDIVDNVWIERGPFRCHSHQGVEGTEGNWANRNRAEWRLCLLFQAFKV